jgi:kexin
MASQLTGRGENPVGTWSIIVTDRNNPEKTGRFVSWSLQLWGECVDPSLATQWQPAEEGQPDQEEIGSPTVPGTQKKPKPTDHLPDDHEEAEGEAHKPGLGGSTESDNQSDQVDEGFFDGIQSLASNSSWIAGAGMIVVLIGAGIGAVFFFRSRNRKRNLFGLSNNGEGARGAYQPVGDEDVPMGLLERGRRKLGSSSAGAGKGSKELYDAFGDGPSDESDDGQGGDENAALRYHDDFLGDDDQEEDGSSKLPEYRDEPENRGHDTLGEGSSTPQRDLRSHSGSSSSWQDAAEEVSGTSG